MIAMQIFTGSIFLGLTCILTKMGTTLEYKSLNISHPKLFINILTHHYILDPFYTFLLTIAMKPPIYQVIGMYVSSLTPATAASSVLTYTVNGNIPLSIALSMCSLISSVILTPAIFTLMFSMYKRYANIDFDEQLRMPYDRMFILMSYVLAVVGLGILIKNKSDVKKVGYFLEKSAICFMLVACAAYFSTPFYNSVDTKNPYIYFGSIVFMVYGFLMLSHFPIICMKDDATQRDAAIITTISRSPGIALAISSISFHDSKYNEKIVGFVLFYSFLRDLMTIPYLMLLRKKRLGHYFFKKGEEDEHEDVEV